MRSGRTVRWRIRRQVSSRGAFFLSQTANVVCSTLRIRGTGQNDEEKGSSWPEAAIRSAWSSSLFS
jgi:hypothetical protein